MTTRLTTSDPSVPSQGEGAGLPDVAGLAALANALFMARPGGAPPMKGLTPPNEAQTYTVPAAVAGGTGLSPQPLVTAPAATSAETCYFLSESGAPTSPNVVPMVNVAPPGLEPGIGAHTPVMAQALNPRGLPERSAFPGQHVGSTVPHTPVIELGTQPFVPKIPPASALGIPTERTLRGVPAFAAGVGKTSPQPGVSTPSFADRPYAVDTIPAVGATTPVPSAPSDGLSARSDRVSERSHRVSGPSQPVSSPTDRLPTQGLPSTAVTPAPDRATFGQYSAPDATVPATPPVPSTEPTTLHRGSPVTATEEASSGAYYFLGETYGLTATPRAPVEQTAPTLVEGSPSAHPPFEPDMVRRDFPILSEQVHGRPLIWLDNAATTQKPQAVIDRLAWFYAHENSNIHRAAHTLAARATDAYEAARDKVARFLHASSPNDIIFVRGTTEAINLIAQSWGRRHVGAGDEIIITWLEHHANIVPWQQLCAEKGATLRVAPVDDRGQVILEAYEKLFNPRTRLVSFTQVSNALGTVTPVREMVDIAHRHGVRVLVDGAQAVSHLRVDVQALDCDWYVFSGHKVFGPTGIGAVYGKKEVLEHMPPWQGGGNMIQDVTFEKTIYQPAPARFEAGTGNIADAVGLGAAIDYLERVGVENVTRHEHVLLVYGTEQLQRVPGLRLIGTAAEKAGVLSFVLEGFRSEAVGEALNREGIAVRSGHHCAQPILRRFGLESTVRPSLALYNTHSDIDALVTALLRLKGGQSRLHH